MGESVSLGGCGGGGVGYWASFGAFLGVSKPLHPSSLQPQGPVGMYAHGRALSHAA